MEVTFQKETAHHWKKLLEDTVLCEQTREWPLPEQAADTCTVRIADGNVFLTGKEAEDGMLLLRGTASVWVFYETENESNLSVQAEIPLSCQIPCPEADRSCRIVASAVLSDCSVRPQGGGKLLIRAEAAFQVSCWKEEQLTVKCQPQEAPAFLQLQETETTALLSDSICEKSFVVMQTAALGEQAPPAAKLLLCSSEVAVSSVQILGAKLLVKGITSSVLLYDTGNDGLPVRTKLQTDFSQIVETDSHHGTDAEVTMALTGTVIRPELSLEPLTDTIHMEYHISLQAVLWREETIHGITDAYAPMYPTHLTAESVKFCAKRETRQQQIPVRASLSSEEAGREVLYLALHPGKSVCQKNDEALRIGGTLNAWALLLGSNGALRSESGGIQWQETAQEGETYNSLRLTGDAFAAPGAGGIDIRENCTLSAVREETKTLSLVTGISLDTENQTPHGEDASLLLHRYSASDTLWELAKTSSSTVEYIQKANELEPDAEIPDGKLLILPRIRE